jgi:hypothetical protein
MILDRQIKGDVDDFGQNANWRATVFRIVNVPFDPLRSSGEERESAADERRLTRIEQTLFPILNLRSSAFICG